MVKVAYFNQWFSSIAWVIDDLKKRNKNIASIKFVGITLIPGVDTNSTPIAESVSIP